MTRPGIAGSSAVNKEENNMRRSLALLATASFLMGTAQARIGDTEEQIRTRYGNPITVLPSRPSDAGLTKCYSSDGFSIAVTYLHGHSVREMFVKSDNSKITKTEIDRLINATPALHPRKCSTWLARKASRRTCSYGGALTRDRASPFTIRGRADSLSRLSSSST